MNFILFQTVLKAFDHPGSNPHFMIMGGHHHGLTDNLVRLIIQRDGLGVRSTNINSKSNLPVSQ
jgi:hypothetical protein